jgi:Kef-type K+ transport system membrane component KefB
MEIFYVLLVLLVATRTLGEVVVRFKQPALVGEILAGVLLGLIVAQYSGTFPVLADLPDNPVFVALTHLGIFFLMLQGGLDLHPRELGETSGQSFLVAASAMLLPLGLGAGTAWAFLPASDYRLAQALFVGTALAITAVPVAIRVLMDLDLLKTRLGRTIVSAAVFDDILSLILLAFLTALMKTGGFPDAGAILLLLGKVALFFLIAGAVGMWILPHMGTFVRKFVKVDELELSFLLIVALAFSVLAEVLAMHFIVGAFIAGLLFGRQTIDEAVYQDVKQKLSGITTGFLAPLFFASIGLHLELGALTAIPLFVVLMIIIAFGSKLAGAAIPARLAGFSGRDASAIGLAMSARGAVELIIAGIALQVGLFDHPDPRPPIVANLFSAVVIVAMVTTFLTPIALRWILMRHDDRPEPEQQMSPGSSEGMA